MKQSRTMNRALICLFFLLINSCINRTVEQESADTFNRSQFFAIDYEGILKQQGVAKLSEIASDIEYVPLETNEECFLRSVVDYHFTEDYIFVRNYDHILMFNRRGKFIRKIGKPGRGPGEIGLIRFLSVLDSDKQLVVQNNWVRELYYFNYEGEFLKSEKVEDVYKIIALPKDRFLLHQNCINGNENYMFAVRNNFGDTLDVVPNHYKWENVNGIRGTVSYHEFRPYYKYQGSYSFKTMYNDTVYNFINDLIRPEYLINLGKYKLPQEYRPEVLDVSPYALYDEFSRLSKDYRFVSVFEASETLFLESHDYSQEHSYNMIFHRMTGEGKTLITGNGLPGGITNDIDGGIDFWPVGAINDSVVYMPVLPYKMLAAQSLNRLNDSEDGYSGKRRRYQDLVSTLSESGNPVLMKVTLKNQSSHLR